MDILDPVVLAVLGSVLGVLLILAKLMSGGKREPDHIEQVRKLVEAGDYREAG